MRFLKRVHLMLVLVALMAALSTLTVGPVRADDTTVSCDPAGFTPIPSTDGNVTLTGTLAVSQCQLIGTDTINGNLIVTGTASARIRGTINGNIEGDATSAGFIDVRGGSVNSNVIQEGTGSLRVLNGSVNGNVEQKGTGGVDILAFLGGDTRVNGNVINEGSAGTAVFTTQGAGTIVIDGSVEAKGGGGGFITLFSGVGPPLFPEVVPPEVTVNGSTCGVTVSAGVVVNGDVKPVC